MVDYSVLPLAEGGFTAESARHAERTRVEDFSEVVKFRRRNFLVWKSSRNTRKSQAASTPGILLEYPPMARVLVTGASGPIGTALLPALKAAGYQVSRLVRGTPSSPNEIPWDPAQPLPERSVSGFDAVIHLAGESIVGRWTEGKKRAIRESRVQGTKHLAEALSLAPEKPRVFVSSSAIGYYGSRGDEVLREDSASGQGFLAEVCREWEATTKAAEQAGIRTAHIRTGVVLSTRGGALKEMLTPFRFGLGGNMGSGKQWWSWIHADDMVGAILHVIKTSSISGAVNMTSPNPARNAEFTKTLGAVLVRPTMFPMPAFVARTVFGQMGDELLLASQRVQPARLEGTAYRFRYPELEGALKALLRP